MKVFSLAAFAIACVLVQPAFAQSAAPHAHGAPATKAASSEMYEGQVRRVNKETRRQGALCG